MSPTSTMPEVTTIAWEDCFASYVGFPHVAPDDPAPERNTVKHATVSVDLPSTALQAFCAGNGVSLHTLLLSGFLALLYRRSEQSDFLLQYYDDASAALLPLRIPVDGNSTFQHLLQQVNHWTQNAAEYTDALLAAFVAGNASRHSSAEEEQPPIVFFGMHGADLSVMRDALPVLGLAGEQHGKNLRLLLFADTTRYRHSTAQELLQAFANLLQSAMVAPETPLAELRLTSASEVRALVLAGHTLDTGDFEPVHTVVQRWAAEHPHRVAVECAGDRVTYAQLVERAAAIAEHMLAAGVEPHSRIALCLERGTDMPAVLLAVLLCGCTYVPLDPLFPRARMEAAVADAGAALLLTDGTGDLPAQPARLLLATVPQRPAAPLPCIAVSASDLAYIIYTSGSTGQPKGVAISHGALRSLMCAMQQTPGFTADDVLVAITTLTFDISVADMWLPLFSGARLMVATQEESRNPALLEGLLNRSGATMLQATPGLWRAMVEQGWTTHAPGAAPVRVLCGGENLSRDLADLLLKRAPEVWNMYGPTECTVWVSATRVFPATSQPGIAALLPNSECYVLDRALHPVPAGFTGELVIGGGNVGSGYWNRPELTTDRFVPNPFDAGMLYRTGDLAQLRPEGGLRLLGRADFQVKVRGFRIELGEIEHLLAGHPAVREAVVVQQKQPAPPGMPAATQLVAFLDVGPNLPEAAYSRTAHEAEEALRRSVPSYMVPAGIVVLPALPRLFNGKVDRKSLPLLAPAAVSAETPYVPPRDTLERQIAAIWQTTLGLDRISIDTSYFSLGLDSLTALRLITRINRTFGTQLGLANLFASNSIAALAGLVRDQHRPGVSRALVPLRSTGTQPPLFLLHGVGGNVLNFYGLASRLNPDQPVYALQAQALLTGQSALLRLEDMATYYLREMRTVQPHGPYRLLGYSFGGTVAAEMARQLHQAGEEVCLLAMLDARTRAFEQAHRNTMGTTGALKNDLARLAGNTGALSWTERARYIARKLLTRTVRYTALALNKLRARRLPSFLKVAWDINLMAFQQYQPKPGRGRLVLFRATDQEFSEGPRDLGWAALFPEGVDIHEFESDHERIFLEPTLQLVAQQLTEELHRTAGPVPEARP